MVKRTLNHPVFKTGILKNTQGFAAIVFAFLIPIIIAVIGLSTEANVWYDTKTRLQAASDAAATAASIELGRVQPDGIVDTGPHSVIRNAVMKAFADNGFDTLSSVEINIPPVSGPNAGNTQAVEVIAHDEVDRLFSSLFFDDQQEITTRSVVGKASSSMCMLALGQGIPPGHTGAGISVGGNFTINEPNCTWASNTQPSLNQNGNMSLVMSEGDCGPVHGTVQSFYTVGSSKIYNACLPEVTDISITGTNTSNAPAVPDPYAAIDFPVFSAGPCDGWGGTYVQASPASPIMHINGNTGPGGITFLPANQPVKIPPGVHCNTTVAGNYIDMEYLPGRHVFNGSASYVVKSLTLDAGEYFVNGGSFNVTPSAALGVAFKATNVTIFLTGTSTSPGSFFYNAGAKSSITMSPPTSGTYAGFLFFGDHRIPFSATGKRLNVSIYQLPGGQPPQLTGITYNPTGGFDFTSNTGGTLSCMPVVSYYIYLYTSTGPDPQVNLDMNCPAEYSPPQTAGSNGSMNLVE